jgi:hypothetical protein
MDPLILGVGGLGDSQVAGVWICYQDEMGEDKLNEAQEEDISVRGKNEEVWRVTGTRHWSKRE